MKIQKLAALVMALVLSSYSAQFICICVAGILLSVLFAVTVHISRIREKIEDDSKRPVHLITVRGVGYKFEE